MNYSDVEWGNLTNTSKMFLLSAIKTGGEYTTVSKVKSWLQEKNRSINVVVNRCPLKKIKGWEFSPTESVIRHHTGKFFSIEGIKVNSNCQHNESVSYQPIINQPEIGYLGIIAKEINGVLHFLLQAKIEPGNVNCVQLSPTLQATKSNYTKVHNGSKPLYLEYFHNQKKCNILVDQLQSEQGSRFLQKRNRNIIILVDDNVEADDNFVWLTLNQIKILMQDDNLVNMDTRSVIACIPFADFSGSYSDAIDFIIKKSPSKLEYRDLLLASLLTTNNSLHTIDNIISFISDRKSVCDLYVDKINLSQLHGWVINDMEVRREDSKYFKVIAVDVEIDNREVVKWSQPMIESSTAGLCAFIVKSINGVLHFAVQAKVEPGNLDVIELAPTVQYLADYYCQEEDNPFFKEYVRKVDREKIVFDAVQSEEGGRFFHDQNRYMLVVAGDEFSEKLPENYIWMTLNQICFFMKFNNYINIQARSLIAAIPFV